jgi:hypothetical protein
VCCVTREGISLWKQREGAKLRDFRIEPPKGEEKREKQ